MIYFIVGLLIGYPLCQLYLIRKQRPRPEIYPKCSDCKLTHKPMEDK